MDSLDATLRIRQYQALRLTPIVAVSAAALMSTGVWRSRRAVTNIVHALRPTALAELIASLLADGKSAEVNAQSSDLEH